MDVVTNEIDRQLTYKRRKRRGTSRFTHVKSGRGRNKINIGSGIGGWCGRRGVNQESVHPEKPKKSLAVCAVETVLASSLNKSIAERSVLHEPQLCLSPTDPEVKHGYDEVRSTPNQDFTKTILPHISSRVIPMSNIISSVGVHLDQNSIDQALTLVRSHLPDQWICSALQSGFNLFMLSNGTAKAIQRQIEVHFNGLIEIFVHCKLFKRKVLQFSQEHQNPVLFTFSEVNVQVFIDNVVTVVNEINSMDVCVGITNEDFQFLWNIDKHGFVDVNPFKERRYGITYRSSDCLLLIPRNKWSCLNCCKVKDILRRKANVHAGGMKTNTSNIYLTDQEKLEKLQKQQTHLKKMKSKVHWLQQKLDNFVKKRSIAIDKEINEFLTEVALLNVECCSSVAED